MASSSRSSPSSLSPSPAPPSPPTSSSFPAAIAQSRKPIDSDFRQQRLKAWKPLLTPSWSIGALSLIAVLFAVLGGFVLVASNQVVEITQRYDNLPSDAGDECTVSAALSAPTQGCFLIPIPFQMAPPMFVYYKLVNFYQNHRRYVKSRSDSQLEGSNSPSLASCDPLESDSQGRTYYPCGLIAASMFNDTIQCTWVSAAQGNVNLSAATLAGNLDNPNWQKSGIAWASDVRNKFKAIIPSYPYTTTSYSGAPLPQVDDEDLIVWMRTSGLPTFKKLYRKIVNPNCVFQAGDTLLMTIDNNFPVSSFDGEKHIVISTTSWIGGRNDFLGWAYVSVAILCAVTAVAFALKQKVSSRPLGDIRAYRQHQQLL